MLTTQEKSPGDAAALRPRVRALLVAAIVVLLPQVAIAAGGPSQPSPLTQVQRTSDQPTADRPFAPTDIRDAEASPAIVVRPLDISALDATAFGDWDAAGHGTATFDGRSAGKKRR